MLEDRRLSLDICNTKIGGLAEISFVIVTSKGAVMFIHTIGIVVVLVILLIASMFKVLREYERAVVFFLGRFYRVKGPGLIVIIRLSNKLYGSIYEPSSWMSLHKT